MKALFTVLFFALCFALTSATATCRLSGDYVNCRPQPNTNQSPKYTWRKNTPVKFGCSHNGEVIEGNNRWAYSVTYDCYISMKYIQTPCANNIGGCTGTGCRICKRSEWNTLEKRCCPKD